MKQVGQIIVLWTIIVIKLNGQCYCEDCPEPIIFGSPSTATLNVSGITNNILGQGGQSLINVGVGFTHDAAQVLSLRIVAPNGSFVDLTIGEGLGFGNNNFFDINFVQCTGSSAPDCTNGAFWTSTDEWDEGPYTGSYFPESGCLEDLTGDVNGVWTLEIEVVSAIEDGELFCFNLTFADNVGAVCNMGGCSESVCLAQGGQQLSPLITIVPEGDPSLVIDFDVTYANCEIPSPTPEYVFVFVIYEPFPGPIIDIVEGTVDMTAYPEGLYLVHGLSILASELPMIQALDYSTTTFSDIFNMIQNGEICADNTSIFSVVEINNCAINFSGFISFEIINAEEGDPALNPDWNIIWSPAAPDFSIWGIYYVVYDQTTGIIIDYLLTDDFTGLEEGNYQVSVLTYLLSDEPLIPVIDGSLTYSDLANLIANEEICGILFAFNQLNISEACNIDANGILEQENITATQGDPALDPDWDITFSGSPPDPAEYGFFYVVYDAITDVIVALYTTDDFTLLLEGVYNVSILYYDLDDLAIIPTPDGNNTFLDIVNLINNGELCAQYFGQNILNIIAPCEAEAGSFNNTIIIECEGASELVLDLTPQYSGNAPDEADYGYTYVVSENGIVIAIDASNDFTGFSVGEYEICGLSYLLIDESLLPSPNGSTTATDIQNDIDSENYCADLTLDCIQLTILETPLPIFTGPTEICAGVEVQYVVENFSGNNDDYLYVINQGGFDQFINDEMGTLSVIWNSGPGNICVIENQNGCSSEEICLTIDILPQPEINIDGLIEICPGEEYEYLLSPIPSGNQMYDISVMGGSIISQNSNSVVIVWDGAPGGGTITASLLGEPCDSDPVVFQVILAPQLDFPTVSIPPSSCLNSGLTIPDIDDPNITDWTWTTTNADFEIVNGFVNFTWQFIGPAEICLEADLGCGIEQMCYDLEVLDFPQPMIAEELEFCSLTFTLDATPDFGNSWFWTSPGSGGSVSFIDQTNFVTGVTVTQPGTYTFILQEFSNECSGTVETTVTVTEGLSIGELNFICEGFGDYIVSFDINSGTAPFTVDGIELMSNLFVSDDILSGDPYSFIVEDSEGCSALVEGIYTCPCISDAGTMSPEPIVLCISSGEEGQAEQIGTTIYDTNDDGDYILHTSNTNVLGDIIAINETGSFSFDPNTMIAGQTYYISFVVGDGLNGSVDLLDPCLSVSFGQPIVFYEDPIIDAGLDDTTCGLVYNLSSNAITVSGTWSTIDQPSGSNADIQLILGESWVEVDMVGLYTFELVASENGCLGSDTVAITFLENPIESGLTTLCDGEFYTVSFAVVGGSEPYTINGVALTGTEFTSMPIQSGDIYSFTIEDAEGCSSEIIQGVEVCNCVTDAGTMSEEEIIICAIEGELISSTFNNDATFDSDDGGTFVLHTNSTNILGQILASNDSGEFVYTAAFGTDVTLYVSYVVANEVGGNIDFSDECLSVSIGQPVNILSLTQVDAGNYEDECFNFMSLDADDFGLTGIWSIVDAPQGSNVLIDNETDPQSFFETDLPGVYSLAWTPTNANCAIGDTTTFTLFPELIIETLTVLCAEDLEDYTVTLEVSGGEAPYFLDGIEVPSNFTSPPIISGEAYNFILSDSRGCELVIQGETNCECTNEVGSMSLDSLQGCTTDTLIGVYNEDAILDSDDIALYVLHTSSEDTLGAVLAISTAPSVVFLPGMISGNVYYLSHVIGNAAGSGIDYTDPCLQISKGQPIIFNGPPELNAGTDQILCELTTSLEGNSTAIFNRWTVIQTPIGAITNIADDNDLNSTFTVNQAGEYILLLEADNGFCTAFDTLVITFLETINYEDLSLNCTSEGYTISFTIVGGSGTYFADGELIVGNFYESELFESGSEFLVEITDESICESLLVDGLFTCLCENDAGTMDATFLELCEDETIDLVGLSNNDYILDVEDEVYYVIHSSSNDLLGNVLGIFSEASVIEIGFNDLPFNAGETYYVSLVLANPGALEDTVDDACIAVAPGTPIRWKTYDEVAFKDDVVACSGAVIDVELSASGAFPLQVVVSDGLGWNEVILIDQADFSFEYSVTGTTTLTMDIPVNASCLNIGDSELEITILQISTAEVKEGITVCNSAEFGSTVFLSDLILSGDEGGKWEYEGNEVVGSIDFAGFEVGEYDLEYILALEGCDLENRYLVRVTVENCDCPIFDFSKSDVTCYGAEDGVIFILKPDGVDINDYFMSLNGVDIESKEEIEGLVAGSYTLEIEDGLNCLASFDVEIKEPAPVQISLGEDMEAEINDPVVIEAITNLLEQEIEGITWTSLSGILEDNGLILNTSFQKDDMISIQILDENGCTGSDDIMVRVTFSDYIIPNVISPNSNSGNNIFKIYNVEAIDEIVHFSIYDRWGNQMYGVDNVLPDSELAQWDGRFGGQSVSPGVYVYRIVMMVQGKEEVVIGDLTVL